MTDRPIVVLDDEEIMRRVLGRVLRSRGYRPVLAETTDEAMVQLLDAPPLAMTVDFDLRSEETGVDFARRATALLGSGLPPLILVSAKTPSLPPHDLALFAACFSKPFGAAALLAGVERVLQPRSRKTSRSALRLKRVPGAKAPKLPLTAAD